MASQDKKAEETPTPPDRSTVVLLLGTIADTTWRMFIPTIGFTYLGWLGDKAWDTRPWLMILGIVIGSVLSALLVRRQINSVKKL